VGTGPPCPAVSVESTGALPARDLVREALQILAQKARNVVVALDEAVNSPDGGVVPAAAAAKEMIAAMSMDAK
jgi:hypothetical protein